jgi:hypothetical protein
VIYRPGARTSYNPRYMRWRAPFGAPRPAGHTVSVRMSGRGHMAPPRMLLQRARGTERKHILTQDLIGAATPRRIPISRYTTLQPPVIGIHCLRVRARRLFIPLTGAPSCAAFSALSHSPF